MWISKYGEMSSKKELPWDFFLAKHYGSLGILVLVGLGASSGMILWGQLSNIYELKLVIQDDILLGGEDTMKIDSFKIWGNVKMLWKSEDDQIDKLLAVLLFGFSLLWPQFKIFCNICIWFVPEFIFNRRMRKTALCWLNFFTTYSLLDVFFLLVLLVAVDINVIYMRFTDLRVEAMLIPVSGGYSYSLGTAFSLVMGHVLQILNTWAYESATNGHEKRRWGKEEKSMFNKSPRWAQILVPILLSVGGGMVLAGMWVKSFEINYSHGFNEALIGTHAGTMHFNIMNFGKALGNRYYSLTSVFCSVIYWTFVVLTPLLRFCCMWAQFFAPMYPESRQQLAHVLEIMFAWSSLDVFIICIALMSLLMGPLTHDFLKPIKNLADPVQLDIMPFGAWILVCGTACIFVAHCILMSVEDTVYNELYGIEDEEEEEEEEGGKASEDTPLVAPAGEEGYGAAEVEAGS